MEKVLEEVDEDRDINDAVPVRPYQELVRSCAYW
jgi:hypothetical protein